MASCHGRLTSTRIQCRTCGGHWPDFVKNENNGRTILLLAKFVGDILLAGMDHSISSFYGRFNVQFKLDQIKTCPHSRLRAVI